MKIIAKKWCALLFVLFCVSMNAFTQNNFTLVIDAGHGGRDPGALGSNAKEKDINLAVALKLGKLIETNHNDVKVLYTRKTDVYLPVHERADIANKNKANLFISIHANAASNKSAYGAETFTMGHAKSDANLEVAMMENSVILLEEDYETKYEGFNPSSVESYIMFELMQDRYNDKSIEFASYIQTNMVKDCKRHDRGVRQGPFLVLHRSACPSVLVELGFISNANDEKYMASAKGQNELAKAVSDAFNNYKKGYDKRSGTLNARNSSNKEKSQVNQSLVFKIQLFATKEILKSNAKDFKGVKEVEYFSENGWYKYTTGSTSDYDEVLKMQKKIKSKFPDAFIVAFDGDKKITVKDARKMLEKE